MFRTIFLIALLIAVASAFAPQPFGARNAVTVCHAKHVRDKAARWAKAKRPRKSRPSDINRKPIVYELSSIQKPAEYTITDDPAVPAVKPE